MGIAVDDQADSVLSIQTTLVAIKELFVADLRGSCLMLDNSSRIEALDVRESVGATQRPDK